jgi:hypothetical protein
MQILDFGDRHDLGESDLRAAGLLKSPVVCPEEKSFGCVARSHLESVPGAVLFSVHVTNIFDLMAN